MSTWKKVPASGRRLGGLLFLLPLLLLTGCGSLTSVVQPRVNDRTTWLLSGGRSIGQTFIAHHDGMTGVEVALAPVEGGGMPPLAFSLTSDPLEHRELARGEGTTLPDGWVRLAFPPLPDSHGERFYLEITWAGGKVAVPLGPAGAYKDGAAYLDGQAREAQLVFRLTYDGGAAALGLLRRLSAGLLPGLAVILLFLLPGLALTAWLLPGGPTGNTSRLILSAGLSVALFPLIFLAARTLGGLKLGPMAVWLLLAACAGLLLWRAWPVLRAGGLRRRVNVSWPAGCLGVVVVLIFGVRLLVVSSLAAPMWGDSYEHTVIAQLTIDHGGLFDSWEPYTPFVTFTIHYGFHAAAALFHWITGADAAQSVMVVGQILNGLAALSLYPLAVRLSGQRWTGVAVVVIAGLLAPVPMFYVNWGRYPQLTSQVVLPVALWFLCEALEHPRWDARRQGLAAITAAGLFLCYYRVGYFYATFALAWWLLYGLVHWRRDIRRWLDSLARVAVVALGAGVLVLPQAVQLSRGYLPGAISHQATQPINWQAILADYRLWGEVGIYTPWPLLALAAVGLAWGLLRRRWAVLSVGLWAIMLVSLRLTIALRLPGAGMVSSSAVLKAWYMPVSLLGAWVAGEVAGWLERRRPKVGRVIVACALLAASLWGVRERMAVVNQGFIMVTHPDRAAMAWIAGHVPPDALFLVNGFAIYGDTSVVGADGGWWIPLLAGRRTTMPPQYALLNEIPSEPGYLERMTRLVLDLQAVPATDPAGQQVLCENGISHIYVGQGQGLVGNSGPALVSAADLAASPAFQTLYHQDRVWVFAFDRSVCQD